MAKPLSQHILGVLASGSGTNFRAIDDAIRDGRLQNAKIGVLLSDKKDSGALKIAKSRGIPAIFLGAVDNDQRNKRISELFQKYGVELGVAAGYLKLVNATVLNLYPQSILNIHPGPLYDFGGNGMFGISVHQAVIKANLAWSGPTVHIMDEVYDQGRILAHVQVPVLDGDTAETLASRILPYEHDLYWRVIAQQLKRGSHPEQKKLK